MVVTESLPLYISITQTNLVVTESLPLYISTTQANMVVTESLLLNISIAQTHLVVTESLSLSSSSIPQSRGSLGHHRLFRNQFFPFPPVLHCPLGPAELQACPFPHVVFPPLPLSALSSPFPPEGRPGMSDVSPLSGIPGLSFDSNVCVFSCSSA